MSSYIEIIVIVEGKTEQIFIESILSPYLALKNIFMTATQVSKPGEKGGDVKFERVVKDIERHLKQRPNTYVSTFVDYYGIKEDWPGVREAKQINVPKDIFKFINQATSSVIIELYSNWSADKRFIPFIAVHEFESLLFSNSKVLAQNLRIDQSLIDEVIISCGDPESINNSPETAPSKRLQKWMPRFKKTTTGIAIASEIAIDTMRKECINFDNWLKEIEKLVV